MASLIKKTFTKPMPADAEIIMRKGERIARWQDKNGKARTAPVSGEAGSERIVLTAKTFTAKYRDAAGIVREVATGCRDEMAARAVLAEHLRRTELVRSGVVSAVEDQISDHVHSPLETHREDYLAHLRAKGASERHVKNVEGLLKRLSKDCNFKRLADLKRTAFERWLGLQNKEKMSARTLNIFRTSLMAFCNWAVLDGRLAENPFRKVAMIEGETVRKRRAFSERELAALIEAARRRPLADRLKIHRGADMDKLAAELKPETRIEAERIGRERGLIYRTLAMTGLRVGELRSITCGHVELEGDAPRIILRGADAKNRKEAEIPLRADLAAELQSWMDEGLKSLQQAAESAGEAIPTRLPFDCPLFKIEGQLTRIFDRDLIFAGISKEDERGRTLDLHCLRHTFATMLSRAGVAPRVAQSLMRHSDISLTMNVYTDESQLDKRGALDPLPSFKFKDEAAFSSPCATEKTVEAEGVSVELTGTDGAKIGASQLAPQLAPTTGFLVQAESKAGNKTGCEKNPRRLTKRDIPKKNADSLGIRVRNLERETGFEPATFSLGS